MSTCEVSLSSSDHLAGDLVCATISFNGRNDTLDWAAVQVHGHCWHDARLVASIFGANTLSQQQSPKQLKLRRSSSLGSTEKKTAMPDMSQWVEGSDCLFSTKPHCLCAELMLEGEHIYTYQVRLPPVLPPSFRGVSTRYGYLLTICVKLRSEASARVAHVPFYIAGTPSSLGDAARMGPPSAFFVEKTSGYTIKKKIIETIASIEDEEEEELIQINDQAHAENRIGNIEKSQINLFPRRYDDWEPDIRSSKLGEEERVWFLERDEVDEEISEIPLPFRSPRSHSPRAPNEFDYGSEGGIKALNAQTAKGRLARCYISPSAVSSGDAINIKLDFSSSKERCTQIVATIEVEEIAAGPPPILAAFEPLLRKRAGAGPWLKTIARKQIDVSICSTCAFSLSTYGAPSDFSTDLIIVHSFLRLEFTSETMVNSLKIPINVRPSTRSTKMVSFSPEFARAVSPKPSPGRRLEEQSPPPTPKKKLVF